MRFLFVDKILSISPTDIWGEIYFLPQTSVHHQTISPGFIGEALGQLVSWKIMSENDFSFRPIYLFSEKMTIHQQVKSGTKITLHGIIHQIDSESVVFSAEAYDDKKLLQELKNCTNYFLPVEEVEDPALLRRQFERLISKDGDPINDQTAKPDFSKYVREILHQEEDKLIHVRCRVDAAAPFYKDHFPKRPITPIVVINEIINRATAMILPVSSHISICEVSRIKIKSFISPDENFDVKIDITDTAGPTVQTVVNVFKAEQHILRGHYKFNVRAQEF